MKLTRDKLKQIIKEELEEAYRDPYGSLSKRFSSKRSYGYDRGAEINAGLGPEDFAPQSQSTKPGRKPDKHGSTNVPVEQRIPLASKLFDIGTKLNQQGSEDGPKIMGLGNLISSLETGDTSLLKHHTNLVNKDGGVNAVLELVQDPELKQKVKDLLNQKQVQESKKKITRDSLKQIVKEELEEILSEANDTVKMKLQGKPVSLMVKRFGTTNFVTIYDARLEEISKYEVSLPNPKTGGSPLINHMSGQDFESDTKEWSKIQSAIMKLVSGGINESDIKVSVSPEEITPYDLKMLARDGALPVLWNGKKFFVMQRANGTVDLYDYSKEFANSKFANKPITPVHSFVRGQRLPPEIKKALTGK